VGGQHLNPSTKKWTTSGTDASSKQLEHAFDQFVLNLIFQDLWHYHELQEGPDYLYAPSTQHQLTYEEHNLDGEQLLKVVMRKFLPGNSLLEMIAITLISPVTTQ
jgi:elongation factor 2